MVDESDELVLPHVLIFPLPIQSPVNSMMKLAELLCFYGIHVTFLITKHNHKRLLRCADVQTRMARFKGRFHLEFIEDGLSEDDPRGYEKFAELLDSLRRVAEPFLRELLQASCQDSRIKTTNNAGTSGKIPITCVIAEGLYSYVLQITEELGIPFIFFETISPCCLWVYLCLNNLIEAGELPFKGTDLDAPVTSIPGMEGFLRLRDLPDFYRRDYTIDGNAKLAFDSVQAIAQAIPQAAGLILNSFAELEGPFLPHIRSKVRNLYSIGPVQLHLKKKTFSAQQSEGLPRLSNSFWKEDKSCLKWLDSQPSKSVIYISFGSLKNLSNDEFSELWHGIINSEQTFLWVIRPGSVFKSPQLEHDELLKELNVSTKGLGLIVDWVSQEEVLGHPAIGGFLTHSGWNSTLESIVEGVPMICWPNFVDQQVTSRFVSEVWKIGLDMKDSCDRFVIERKIKDLMEMKVEYEDSAKKWSKLARESVVEGGSSLSDFCRLIEDIKQLSMK